MGRNKAHAVSITVLALLVSVGQASAVPLQAGDANIDLEVNSLDMVQVFVAGKYLTGQPATWAQGDWNGAPGGEPGDPPPGDGLFDELDIIAALHTGLYEMGPYNGGGPTSGVSWPDVGVLPGGVVGDAQTSIVYDASTGEIAVDAAMDAGAVVPLSSVFIGSAASIFTGTPPDLPGVFDNADADSIFQAFVTDSGSLSFGPFAQSGLSEAFLLSDLRVLGTRWEGGGLGDVDLVYLPVPEPCTALLLGLGLTVLAAGRRR